MDGHSEPFALSKRGVDGIAFRFFCVGHLNERLISAGPTRFTYGDLDIVTKMLEFLDKGGVGGKRVFHFCDSW